MLLNRTRFTPALRPLTRLVAACLCGWALAAIAPMSAADAEPGPAPDAEPAPKVEAPAEKPADTGAEKPAGNDDENGGEEPAPEPPKDEEPGQTADELGAGGENIAKKAFKTTSVPKPEYNFGTQAYVWHFSMDPNKQREPFSYSRATQAIDRGRGPETRPDVLIIEDPKIGFFTSAPSDYRNALDQFEAAVVFESRYSPETGKDDELSSARSVLNGCLLNLEKVRKLANDAQASKTLSEAERKTLNYYSAAANNLSAAARRKLDMVSLRLQFNAEVLRQPDFKITAIQTNFEDPEWPSGAVQFANYPHPVLLGDIVKRGSGANLIEMKITALSPKKVTVLFQHQATFDIPVLLEAK